MKRVAFAVVFLFGASSGLIRAQMAINRYQEAEHILHIHSSFGYHHDDSKAAVDALTRMWAISAEVAVTTVSNKPEANARDIEAALCGLQAPAKNCGDADGAYQHALQVGPRLFVVAQTSGEAGTVFVIGPRNGKPQVLWSINSAKPQKSDPRNLIGAWTANRAGEACKESKPPDDYGVCGPLAPGIATLPSDADGSPRFYIDAYYPQLVGGTIGNQTSVWRWNGDTAELLWIELYPAVIFQKTGVTYADGILAIGEREEFRSFFSCGSCEGRQVVRRLRITPTGIKDLGKVSQMPALDLIDELFWRLSKNAPTADIAAPKVSRLLTPEVAAAKREAEKNGLHFFTVGMLTEPSPHPTRDGNLEHLCFLTDELSPWLFTMQEERNKVVRIINATTHTDALKDCQEPTAAGSKH